jgi:hypothetical protein
MALGRPLRAIHLSPNAKPVSTAISTDASTNQLKIIVNRLLSFLSIA